MIPGGDPVLSDRPRVLLLLASTSYRAEDFLSAANRLGVDVAVGSDHRQALAEIAPAAAVELDFGDSDGSLARVLELHADAPLAGAVAAEDEGVPLAAQVAATLGLRSNSPEAVLAARRKDLFRERLTAAGLPGPAWRVVADSTDPGRLARELKRSIGYPCVLKPLALSASRGVIRVDDARSFPETFARVTRIVADADDRGVGGEHDILVEGYLPGVEVAVEAMLEAGRLTVLAILDKPDPLEGPYFEETMFIAPSRLPESVQRVVALTVSQTAEALGLTEGPVHAEFRVNEKGVWPLELAPRSIGGLCSRLFRFRSGASLEELILRHALGMELAGAGERSGASGVMMIPIPRAGVLRAVAGTEEAASVDGIEDVVISLPVGHQLVPLPEGHAYLGFLFARGEGPDSVETALRTAHERLEFEISPR